MVVEIKVSYPWGGIVDDNYILNVSDNTIDLICNKFNLASDNPVIPEQECNDCNNINYSEADNNSD